MNTPVDQKFVQKLQTLIQEVLSDEARFVSKNEQQFATLHHKIFSKVEEAPFATLQPLERESFKKYFYFGGSTNTPRPDVPFTDSEQDQAFFFDQFRTQVKNCTFGFDRMDFLRPSFTDEKAAIPTFNQNQTAFLVRGVVYPLMFSIEQREIASVEQRKSASVISGGGEKSANPYEQLGEKLLVQGQSGQFDVVLTYAQLEEIALQEDQLRQQGLDQSKVVELLSEYIRERFPDLNIFLTAEGKVVTFMSATGISASGNLNGKNAVGNPGDLPTPIEGGQTFAELLQEMKLRQGRQLQYDALIASKGSLNLSAPVFQVSSGGINADLNGLSLELDQSGAGNNVVFFVTDRQGVSARVVVDTATYRIDGKPDYHIKIYEKPQLDSPTSPKIKLPKDQLSRLKTPLLALYRQMQAPESYTVVPDLSGVKLPESGKKPNLPADQGSVESSFGPGGLPGLGLSASRKPKIPGMTVSQPSQDGGKISGAQQPPKLPSGRSLPLQPKSPAPKAGQPLSGVGAGVLPKVGQPTGTIEQAGTRGKLPSSDSATSSPTDQPKRKIPAGAIVALSTGLPIVATLMGGIAQILINTAK